MTIDDVMMAILAVSAVTLGILVWIAMRRERQAEEDEEREYRKSMGMKDA